MNILVIKFWISCIFHEVQKKSRNILFRQIALFSWNHFITRFDVIFHFFFRCWWTKQESYQGYPRPIWQNSPCCRSPTMRIQEVRRSRSQGQIPKVLPLRLYWLYFEFQLWCGNKNKSVWRKPTYTVCKLKNFSATQILRENMHGQVFKIKNCLFNNFRYYGFWF